MSNIKVNTIEAQSGNSIVSNSYIKCSIPPIQPNDLVNKQYVDSILPTIPTTSTVYVDTQDQFYAQQADLKFVDKANDIQETITGTKTFTKRPKCSLVPSGPEDLANKEYVDSQKGAAVIESNLYTDTQISAFQISQIGPYYRFFVTSAITGASASFTDPVTNLTARGYYTLYADTGGGAVFFDGINGISITASDDEETYNKVIEIDGVPGVTSATEIVNRIIIDAKALGHAPQVWTNMLSSRSNGTNYVNTTSRPIMVMVKPDFQTSVQISVGATHTGGGMVTIYSNNNSMEPPSFVVPISHVYNVTFGSFPTSPNGSWMELR